MRRKYDLDDDDDTMIPDGGRVRVPLYLCDDATQRAIAGQTFDAAAHQPGYRMASDAARRKVQDARAQWIRKMCDAWRTPHKDASEPDAAEALLRRHLRGEPDDDTQSRRDRGYQEYCDRISNAWRTNPQAATAIERQGERWRHGR